MATNLTGVYFTKAGSHKLRNIYKKILIIAAKCPKDSFYRRNVEDIIQHRLCIVQESGDDRAEIENRICCGTIEDVISQANAEFILLQKLILWKPWDPLMERPPPGQWKWPPY